MLSKYRVGDEITILIRGFDGDDWNEKGIVAEVRKGNPPDGRPCNLPTEAHCYRLEGQTRFFRESAVVSGKRKRKLKEAYKSVKGCVTNTLNPLPA